MTEPVVQRIEALVRLDDPEPELERARRAARDGDEDMAEWLCRYDAGDALVVSLHQRVTLRDGDATDELEISNRAIWVERHFHVPQIEHAIHEVANKDVDVIAEALRERGCDVSEDDVQHMLVHLELGDDVRERLGPPHDGASAGQPLTEVGDTPP